MKCRLVRAIRFASEVLPHPPSADQDEIHAKRRVLDSFAHLTDSVLGQHIRDRGPIALDAIRCGGLLWQLPRALGR